MIINNLININEMMSMKCKNLSRLLFRGQSRTCLLDFRDCSLHLDNLLPPEGERGAIFYLMTCLFLFLSLHQSRCIVGLSILHDHLFQVDDFPLSASSSLSLFLFYTDLIISSLEQLCLVVSQFVFHAGCPGIISCRLPKAGCLVTTSKADCFYFMSVSLAF